MFVSRGVQRERKIEIPIFSWKSHENGNEWIAIREWEREFVRGNERELYQLIHQKSPNHRRQRRIHSFVCCSIAYCSIEILTVFILVLLKITVGIKSLMQICRHLEVVQ